MLDISVKDLARYKRHPDKLLEEMFDVKFPSLQKRLLDKTMWKNANIVREKDMERNDLLKRMRKVINGGTATPMEYNGLLICAYGWLKETDFKALCRIIKPVWRGDFEVQKEDGKKSITLHEFDQGVTLCFDENEKLIG